MTKYTRLRDKRNVLFMVNGIYYFADKYRWVEGVMIKRAYENATFLLSYLTVLCPRSQFTWGIQDKDFVIKVQAKYSKVINIRVHPNGDISIDDIIKRDRLLRDVHPCLFVMFLLVLDVFPNRVTAQYLRARKLFSHVVAHHLDCPRLVVRARTRETFDPFKFPAKK